VGGPGLVKKLLFVLRSKFLFERKKTFIKNQKLYPSKKQTMAEDFQKQLEMLNMDTRAFQHLEEEIKKVIQELSEDANMERFRREFEKLYTALKGSHEREATHLKKCRELNDSIIQDTFGVKIQISP
jgi:TRAP-type C4-dicarboxylate transport system substrate-binding protein